MSADEFSADPDLMRLGGKNLLSARDLAAQVHLSLLRIQVMSGPAFGQSDDQVGFAVREAVEPSQGFALDVMSGLADLTSGHADSVGAASTLIGGVAVGAVDIAGGGRRA